MLKCGCSHLPSSVPGHQSYFLCGQKSSTQAAHVASFHPELKEWMDKQMEEDCQRKKLKDSLADYFKTKERESRNELPTILGMLS